MQNPIRPRRLRGIMPLRQMVQRVTLRRGDFILPVFVVRGERRPQGGGSMPGVFQMSVDVAVPWLAGRPRVRGLPRFGVIDRARKNRRHRLPWMPDNVVCRLLKRRRRTEIPMAGITDLCFCEYTSHGHCGPSADDERRWITSHGGTAGEAGGESCEAGAAVIAPSGMMDGTVGALRGGLDAADLPMWPSWPTR